MGMAWEFVDGADPDETLETDRVLVITDYAKADVDLLVMAVGAGDEKALAELQRRGLIT